jgi:hypothetical protein
MKTLVIVTLLSNLIIGISFSQKWSYTSGSNAFDGEYKTASIVGKGGLFPYNKPLFVVNIFSDNNLNIYITNAGYAGCDNKIIYIKFDSESLIYSFTVTTNSTHEGWFLNKNIYDSSSLTNLELIENLKLHNKIYVRLSSDCNQSDYEFSLVGSSVALNYIITEYLKKKKDYAEMLASGKRLKTTTIYAASIYYVNQNTKLFDITNYTLSNGEVVEIEKLPNNDEFYILKKSSSSSLPNDCTFYIKNAAINMNTLELVK